MILKDDIYDLTKKEKEEMFHKIYISGTYNYYKGFDKLNGELLIQMFEELSDKDKSSMYRLFGKQRKDATRFINLFWEHDRDRLWHETFKRTLKFNQSWFLENHYNEYLVTYKYENKEKYNWNEFKCRLEVNSSKWQQIQDTWNELGMQVYECNEGKMCPCLRESANGGSYKCFWRYLEENELTPTGYVPIEYRRENK